MSKKPRTYKLRVDLPPNVDEKALKKEIAKNIKYFTQTYGVDKKDITSKIEKLESGADGSIVQLLVITVLGTVLANVGEHVFREYVLQPIMKKWKTKRVQNG